MKIRFYNAKILAMAAGHGVTEGELWVEGNKIVYVGEQKSADTIWDREIDCQGNLLMPGFKNAHTHSAMTFLRSYADDLPLLEWLQQQVFPMEAKINSDDIYHLSKLAIMEYLSSGITSNFDMYFTPDTIAQASVDCGYRTVMVGGVNNFSQSLQEVERWYQTYNNYHELISFQLGFHAEYTCSKELLEGMTGLSKQFQAPVYCHNSECADEVQQCLERTGMTPTGYLNSLGLFEFGGGGYHCVHMTKQDLDIFEAKGLSVITNPGSNVKLASGIASISNMMKRGITIGIGTDGAASNNCLDMFREMFLVTGLAKLKENDASAVNADEVLKMAIDGSAKAMGLTGVSTLEAGMLADIILIDLQQPNMQPLNHLSKNIVYSGSKQNVKMTMVNGKILYQDGQFYIGTDPQEIYAKANEIVARVKNS